MRCQRVGGGTAPPVDDDEPLDAVGSTVRAADQAGDAPVVDDERDALSPSGVEELRHQAARPCDRVVEICAGLPSARSPAGRARRRRTLEERQSSRALDVGAPWSSEDVGAGASRQTTGAWLARSSVPSRHGDGARRRAIARAARRRPPRWPPCAPASATRLARDLRRAPLPPHGHPIAELILTVLSSRRTTATATSPTCGCASASALWEHVARRPGARRSRRRSGRAASRRSSPRGSRRSCERDRRAASSSLDWLADATRCRGARLPVARCPAWGARRPPACCCSPSACATSRSTPTSPRRRAAAACCRAARSFDASTTRCSR